MSVSGSHNVSLVERPALVPPGKWMADEKRFVWLVIVIVLVIASVPYAYAYLSTPPGQQYMGIMLDVPDHAQYFSWMRELSTQWLASNKMTPEVNQPLFFNLLWWGLGRLGRLLGVNAAVMFQLLRVSATVLFLLLAYRICQWFFKEGAARRATFLLITFTSGLGWVLVALKYITGNELIFPLDVYIAEGNTFLGMLGYPHFIAAALYIFVFDLLLQGQARNQLRYAVYAGFFALFLGWQHAYDLVSVYGIWLAYAVLLALRDRRLPWYAIKSGLILGIISGWPALYSVLLTSFDPVWKGVLQQFANAGVYTPGLLHLPILFGFTLLLALYTLVRMNLLRLGRIDDGRLFLIGWFLVTFGLIYLPVDYQIHLLNGWQVPMAVLAVMGLFDYVIPWFQRQARMPERWKPVVPRLVTVLVLLLVIPTNVYLWTWRFLDLSRHTYPYYLYQDELSAMDWLETNAAPDDVVLSSLTIGQYVPALTGCHAYLAHWAQTLDFYTKSENVDAFLQGKMNLADESQLFRSGSVDYLFWGPAEQEAAGDRTPDLTLLKPVYQNDRVIIYKVNTASE